MTPREERIEQLLKQLVELYQEAIKELPKVRDANTLCVDIPYSYLPNSLKEFMEDDPYILLELTTGGFTFGERGGCIQIFDTDSFLCSTTLLVVATDCLEGILQYISDEVERTTLEQVANKLETMTAMWIKDRSKP